jgi:hypothetical protein
MTTQPLKISDGNRRAPLVTVLIITLGSLQLACAWIKVSAPPQYRTPNPLPITVGVELSGTPSSQEYGPRVISLLEEMRLFKSMVYPYREGDAVDGMMFLSIDGSWKVRRGRTFWSGFLIGLSLFTLSPFLGASMVGTHEAELTLSDGPINVGHATSRAVTPIKWGLLADTDEIAARGNDLQVRTIAVGLARAIEADRTKILTQYLEATPTTSTPSSTPDSRLRQLPATTETPAKTSPSVASELERLAELRSRGLISDDEFAKAKLRVLGQ